MKKIRKLRLYLRVVREQIKHIRRNGGGGEYIITIGNNNGVKKYSVKFNAKEAEVMQLYANR